MTGNVQQHGFHESSFLGQLYWTLLFEPLQPGVRAKRGLIIAADVLVPPAMQDSRGLCLAGDLGCSATSDKLSLVL